MNKQSFRIETIFRALGLILLLFVLLSRAIPSFPQLLPDDKLINVTIAAAVLLAISYYLKYKNANINNEIE